MSLDDGWPDLAGRLDNRQHILPIRVYFEDTDFSGLVYHASYLRFCERGRSDFLRLLDIHHHDLFDGGENDDGAAFVVRRMEIDYLKPARIDEILEVCTRCEELGAATIDLVQEVRRAGEVLVKVRVKVVLIGMNGKPRRLGRLIRQAFSNS